MNKSLPYIFFLITTLIFFHSFVPAQNKNQNYVFPEANSEFIVEFPQKPEVTTISRNNTVYESAVIVTPSGSISALYMPLSEDVLMAMKGENDKILRERELDLAKQKTSKIQIFLSAQIH